MGFVNEWSNERMYEWMLMDARPRLHRGAQVRAGLLERAKQVRTEAEGSVSDISLAAALSDAPGRAR